MLSVQAVYGHAEDGIRFVAYLDPGLGISPHAVLGTEQRRDADAGQVMERVDDVREPRRHRGRTRHDADPGLHQKIRPFREEHVDAGRDRGRHPSSVSHPYAPRFVNYKGKPGRCGKRVTCAPFGRIKPTAYLYPARQPRIVASAL